MIVQKDELSTLVNTANMDNEGINYIIQEIELDAFAFTKYYLKKYEVIDVIHPSKYYESLIEKYVESHKNFM